ncbi:3418_t:CDS:2 [Gigaspora margarita]|uniref:3418_t:CDS:1 n=1 Tax=Gigaspora margarita TaxID=4874 RepID=A0ABM8W466_GIGMA|nr:3418_t:CDS:2 [Gigaspora margarita]
MTSNQNKQSCLVDSGAQKKSRYSKLQNQLKSLENRFDILDDDLIEIMWEIDNIKKKLSDLSSSSEYHSN